MSRVFRGTRVLLQAAKAATKPSSASTATTAAPAATSKKKPSIAAAAAAKPKKTRSPSTPNSGIFKLTPVSPALHDFLGASEASRSDAVKKVWDYIKLHNLQNPANKREINCDEKLKTLFEGKDKVEMLEIARILSRHFVKTG
ncbi:hypothetical protein ACH5RR_000580 [Cinchona calisaya]|uniref:DM2 domain-containing protein n=1 Tax=Cinchona calisaya TaxID=153742 RepID=A0ABD3B237_9GENT